MRYRRREGIVASFFGDGATEEGVFAESLNFAVLKRLPILFVCENNRYAIHTHQSQRQGSPDICVRARASGMPAERLDGDDLLGVVARSRDVVRRIRGGAGPWFFEVMTYRWREHVGPGRDYHLGYRSEDEAAPFIANDPLRRLASQIDGPTRASIEDSVEREIADAFPFAEGSPFPEPAELLRDVFKEEEHGRDVAADEERSSTFHYQSAV
jgi:TPP-dependent pyruvate/acetoin dehydrogenase alpha subunit